MYNLILPCAGLSTRYPLMKPKYLLPVDNYESMLEFAISQLPMQDINQIIIGVRSEHYNQYPEIDGVVERIGRLYKKTVACNLKSYDTESQLETVKKLIKQYKLEYKQVLIKDCDGLFHIPNLPDGRNFVVYGDFRETQDTTRRDKSTLDIKDGKVSRIAEKDLGTDYFSVGGYGFARGEYVLGEFGSPKKRWGYASSLIKSMLEVEYDFLAIKATNYVDLGNIDKYHRYCGGR